MGFIKSGGGYISWQVGRIASRNRSAREAGVKRAPPDSAPECLVMIERKQGDIEMAAGLFGEFNTPPAIPRVAPDAGQRDLIPAVRTRRPEPCEGHASPQKGVVKGELSKILRAGG